MAGKTVKWHPHRYADLAHRHGWNVLWYQATRCPNTRHDCPVCHGEGQVWADPVAGVVTIGTLDQKREFLPAGELVQGELRCSIAAHTVDKSTRPFTYAANPLYATAENDTLVLVDVAMPASAVLERGRRDRLPYRHPVALERVVAILDDELQTFTPDTDVRLNDREVEWLHPLPEGTEYTVHLTVRPEYTVWRNLPGFRRPAGHKLPKVFGLTQKAAR